ENAGLKAAIDSTIGWQQSTDPVNVESVRMLVDIETPATDAFLAEVRAQGADELAELYFTLAAHEANRYIADSWRESARFAKDYAAQLRKGGAA
ncbi:hypothetical protein OGB43_005174, partial [Salmonella enterica]|nr:hypothetical protein [Salmonella enterica]